MTHPVRPAARLTPALVLTLLVTALLGVPFARNTVAPTAPHAPTPLLAGDNDKGGMGG